MIYYYVKGGRFCKNKFKGKIYIRKVAFGDFYHKGHKSERYYRSRICRILVDADE